MASKHAARRVFERALFSAGGHRIPAGARAELLQHLQALYHESRGRGASHDGAIAHALKQFGPLPAVIDDLEEVHQPGRGMRAIAIIAGLLCLGTGPWGAHFGSGYAVLAVISVLIATGKFASWHRGLRAVGGLMLLGVILCSHSFLANWLTSFLGYPIVHFDAKGPLTLVVGHWGYLGPGLHAVVPALMLLTVLASAVIFNDVARLREVIATVLLAGALACLALCWAAPWEHVIGYELQLGILSAGAWAIVRGGRFSAIAAYAVALGLILSAERHMGPSAWTTQWSEMHITLPVVAWTTSLLWAYALRGQAWIIEHAMELGIYASLGTLLLVQSFVQGPILSTVMVAPLALVACLSVQRFHRVRSA